MLENQEMETYPTTDDPLVAALQRLLMREGGHVAVGDAAGINGQSLYQIANLKTRRHQFSLHVACLQVQKFCLLA